jgi:hypothetical protein
MFNISDLYVCKKCKTCSKLDCTPLCKTQNNQIQPFQPLKIFQSQCNPGYMNPPFCRDIIKMTDLFQTNPYNAQIDEDQFKSNEYILVLPGPGVKLGEVNIPWGNKYTDKASTFVNNWQYGQGLVFGTEYWGGFVYVDNINIYIDVNDINNNKLYTAHIYYLAKQAIFVVDPNAGEARTYGSNIQIFNGNPGEKQCVVSRGELVCGLVNQKPGVIILGLTELSQIDPIISKNDKNVIS